MRFEDDFKTCAAATEVATCLSEGGRNAKRYGSGETSATTKVYLFFLAILFFESTVLLSPKIVGKYAPFIFMILVAFT